MFQVPGVQPITGGVPPDAGCRYAHGAVVPTQAVADAAVVGGNAGEGPAVEYAVVEYPIISVTPRFIKSSPGPLTL